MITLCALGPVLATGSQAVEKPASLGILDNERKKDVAAAAALKETGGRNEFRHPFKYASGEKDESCVFDFSTSCGPALSAGSFYLFIVSGIDKNL